MVLPQQAHLLKGQWLGVGWCALDLVLAKRIFCRCQFMRNCMVKDCADVAQVNTARVDRWARTHQVIVEIGQPVTGHICKLQLPRTFSTKPPPQGCCGLLELVLCVWLNTSLHVSHHHRHESSVNILAWVDVFGNQITHLCSGQTSHITQLHHRLIRFA